MAEPEEVIIEGAHRATALAARLWSRHRRGPPRVELGEVRPRLELLLGALFGRALPIVPAEPPARPSFAGRLARRIPRHLIDDRPIASTDGQRVKLPPSIPLGTTEGERVQLPTSVPLGTDRAATVTRYRLLALEQAARAVRGTPLAVTTDLEPHVRDLYLLSEAAAADRWLALELPGLVPALQAARRDALTARPPLSALTARERAIEQMLREVLQAAPATPPPWLPVAETPADSLAWARSRAPALASLAALGGRYRGLPPVPLWGRAEPAASTASATLASDGAPDAPPPPTERVRTMRRRPRIRVAPDNEDDGAMGMLMIQLDDPQEHVEDPMGLQRPADRDQEKDPDDLADSLSELPEARLVSVPGAATEVLASEDPPPRRAVAQPGVPRAIGIAYPEWDFRIGAYHPAAAVVRELPVAAGDAEWVRTVRRRYAPEVERVRRRFERLRPRRVRVGRAVEGEDVDIAAWTNAWADSRAGRGGEDRLYETVRPVRRDIAISLLVDVSGSTDSWLAGSQRIIDVEKEALLLVCEALDALGDRFAVTAFSGHGPEAVALYPVKRFEERYGDEIRCRIAGLEHDRYTRMGAALRHATALLCRETAYHRLLVLLTDGKPNDVDLYEGRYGIEDTRQAVAEARLQGLHPFCLTVDREAPAYLPRLFGAGGYTVLRRVPTLPQALVEVVRRLLRG